MDQVSEIYKMKLHESITINDIQITKVPGGWIYRFYTTPFNRPGISESCVFVPYSSGN